MIKFRTRLAAVGLGVAVALPVLLPTVASADVPPGVLPPEVDTPYSIMECYRYGQGVQQLVNPACGQVIIDGAVAFYKFFDPDPAG